MAKDKSKKVKAKKDHFITSKQKGDGTTEVYITKSPSKTLWGKVIVAILAIGMVVGTVAGLIIVIVNYIQK